LFYFYDLKQNKRVNDLKYLVSPQCKQKIAPFIKKSKTPGELIRNILKCEKSY